MPISTAVFAFSVACLTCLIVTPLVRRFAVRVRWRDFPRDAEHKVRRSTRTHAGGIALLAALMVALWSVDAAFVEVSARLRSDLLFLLPGVLLATGIGLIDDLRGCRPLEKLLVQTVGAAIVVAVVAPLPPTWILATLTVPTMAVAAVFALWIVGTTNAVNLVDGADGLAPGLATLNAAGLAAVAVVTGELAVGILAAATAGCAMGFLRSNRHPAKIYLGDSGSMLLGFVLGALGVVLVARSESPTVALAVVLMGWVPLLDTLLAVLRRVRSGVSPFRPDRDHVHHRLIAHGMSVPTAVACLCATGIVATGAGLAVVLGASAGPWLAAVGIVTLPLARVVLPLKVTARVDDPRRAPMATPDPTSEPALRAAQNRAA
mgnify:FL=1